MTNRLLGATICIVLAADSVSRTQEPQQTFRSGVELVSIPITVTDRAGRRVATLSKEDLRLEEDGKAQEIAILSSEPQALAITVCVDYSSSMQGDRIDAALAAVRAVGEALEDIDRWSVAAFADRYQPVILWAPFDDMFFSRMRSLRPQGGTRLYDAVVAANDTLSTAPHRKRAILVISDGNDLSAQIGSDFEADLNTLTYAGTGERNAVSNLRKGEALLYAFGMDWPYRSQRTGARGPSERVDKAALERLALPTGGTVWMPKSRSELVSAAKELMTELRSQFTIAYSPSKAFDGRYRRIKVTSVNPEYRVRHRTGYVAAARR